MFKFGGETQHLYSHYTIVQYGIMLILGNQDFKMAKKTKSNSWKRQKELQKKYRLDEVPDLNELINIINSIKIERGNYYNYYTARARALFSLYYLTGCRVSEIVKCNSLRIQKKEERPEAIYRYEEKVAHDYQGLKREDIKFLRIDGKKCMIIRTENRKNKYRTTKKMPIPIELELPLVKYILEYMIKYVRAEDLLFPFGVKRATQIINETVGWNVHFIRHIRATHLVTKYDYNEQLLIKFMGWTDSRPAKAYMELSSKDLFRQFFRGHDTQ